MITVDEAEMYELFGYPSTTHQDCSFLQDAFSMFGQDIKTILDLACGTGRHAIGMTKRGYSVTGVDISPKMLNVARAKASEQKLTIDFMMQDIRRIDFKVRFDACYCLFNTLITFTRNEDLLNIMNGVNGCLKPGGLFIIEVGNLWSYIARGLFQNSQYEREDEKQGWKRIRQDKTVIGPYNNIYSTETLTKYSKNDAESQQERTVIPKRVFSINELDLLFRLTGFRILEVYGSTNISNKIPDPNTIQDVKDAYASFVFVLTPNEFQNFTT